MIGPASRTVSAGGCSRSSARLQASVPRLLAGHVAGARPCRPPLSPRLIHASHCTLARRFHASTLYSRASIGHVHPAHSRRESHLERPPASVRLLLIRRMRQQYTAHDVVDVVDRPLKFDERVRRLVADRLEAAAALYRQLSSHVHFDARDHSRTRSCRSDTTARGSG